MTDETIARKLAEREKAAQALRHFEQIKRADGSDPIWTRTDSAPEWVNELVWAAHDNMLPDDYRYEFIVSALGIIAEGDDSEDVGAYVGELDAATDIYSSNLYEWLASNLSRAGYVDEATEELGHSDVGISGDIAMGQYREREEVLSYVLDFLRDMDGEEA